MNVEDKLLIKNLAHTAEIVNTINGGMAQPNIDVERQPEEWMVKVKVPGVSAESLKIEVRDNHLMLFHIMTEPNVSDISIPYLVTMLTLTSKVDLDGIVAEFENNELFIHLPLNGQANGYEREIEILKR